MKIEKISIQNFYSFKNTQIDFGNYSGLTLIKGKNKDTGGSNGSGKSALVVALYFGLSGKTIRKSTEDSLVNNQAKKNCVVKLSLTHNNEAVTIIRQKKPTKLEFFIGEDNRTKETVGVTQSEIESFLNINPKVLLASMFFGQSNDVNFLECTADDKRTIIRNFLDLEDTFKMRDKIRSKKSSFYQSMKEKDAIIAETNKNIAKLEKKIKEVAKAKAEYTQYDESVLSLSLDYILDEEKKEFEKEQKIAGLKKEIATLMEKIEVWRDDPDGANSCPACGQWILPRPDPTHTKNEIDKDASLILKYSKELTILEDHKSNLPITSREFSKVLEYKELCRDQTNYSDLVKEFFTSIEEAQAGKDTFKTWYEIMRFWEKAFSEQGVIKYVIRNILKYFNERCTFYLSYLTNSKYSVEFNEELVEKIETNKRVIQYISLSGGEKRKLNLAVMLGLKDLLLLTDNSHVDLIFFDEVAENIDEDGVEGLHQLLQEIKKTKTIFIITHNKHLKTLLDSSPRLSIIKEKGISKIKV